MYEGFDLSRPVIGHTPHATNSFLLWEGKTKDVPPTPDSTEIYPETDARHWHNMEFAGLNVVKAAPLTPPSDGAAGKRVICVKAESDGYQRECERSMVRTAQAYGLDLSIRVSGWRGDSQEQAFYQAVREKPDLIINIPGLFSRATSWYRCAYEAGIPVIGTTLAPPSEAFRYIIAWCGHDAWLESRMLARQFAVLMDFTGGYALVRHMPDCSTFYSRTYGVLTELTRVAPQMRCLAMETSYLDGELTEVLVRDWLARFGTNLRGIVSANDGAVLSGINKALITAGRSDLMVVSNGTTRKGMQHLKCGDVSALTFKSPQLDGEMPIKIASDWLNGLVVDPVRFLPSHIITRDNVDEFLGRNDGFPAVDFAPLGRAIESHQPAAINRFFEFIYLRFVYARVVPIEVFQGFAIELFSYLMRIMQDHHLNPEPIVGSYESVFKSLFCRPSADATLDWMRVTATRILEDLRHKGHVSTAERVFLYVDQHLKEPLSLKQLSNDFHISARYLGHLFRKRTGQSFNSYVNDRRMQQAANYLRNSSMSAAEVGRELGYAEPDYFYKLFRRHTGMSTTQFRQQ